MLKNSIFSFILIVGCANSILSQQVRPLPSPKISISCNRASILRHTGLIPPLRNQPIPQTCTYTIHAINLFICQIRLDFAKFSLPQPSMSPSGNAFQSCNDGHLQVGNITLCGENTGQHMYIPINPRNLAERQLKIQIVTNGRNGNVQPDWNIEVHQFECPLGQSRRMIEIVSKDQPIEGQRSPKTLVSDWLPPPGCLQYHANPTGRIESFNFNNGQGPYIGDMNYAICFRRPRAASTLKLIRTFFQVGDAAGDGINEDCFPSVTTIGRSEDFLFIPHGLVDFPNTNSSAPPSNGPNRTVRATHFCGNSLTIATGPVTSTPPGPLMVVFNSDRQYYPNTEYGFRLEYEIL